MRAYWAAGGPVMAETFERRFDAGAGGLRTRIYRPEGVAVPALKAAGVATEARLYAGAMHSFLEAMSIAEVARRAIRDGAAFVRTRLQSLF